MVKIHELEPVSFSRGAAFYFSIREKNDVNGNPRFRVYIMYRDIVWETIFKCYSSQISERVKTFLEGRDLEC